MFLANSMFSVKSQFPIHFQLLEISTLCISLVCTLVLAKKVHIRKPTCKIMFRASIINQNAFVPFSVSDFKNLIKQQ